MRWIDTLEGAQQVAAALSAVQRVGVDTEFHAERRYTPELFLVQVFDGTEVWVIDPLAPGVLASLAPALCGVQWVVHGGRFDMVLLHRALGDLPSRVWDTQIAAGMISADFPVGYARLVAHYLGQDLPKGETLSNWSVRPLRADQLQYAADDATLLLRLFDAIEVGLEARGRRELAAHACDHARDATFSQPDHAQIWRRVPGAAWLDAEGQAVLQRLVAWREGVAIAKNQPPFAVISNTALVMLAKHRPSSVEAMSTNRRLPKGAIKRHGPALVEAMADARPLRQLLPHPRSGVVQGVAWMEIYLHAWSTSQGLAWRALQLERDDLCDLLYPQPTSFEALNTSLDWRAGVLGELLWAAFSGASGLVLDGGAPTRIEVRPSGEKYFLR